MYKFSSNNFQKGLNKDFDSRIVPENTYRDAVNVTLVKEGELLSLSVINGSEKLTVFDSEVTDNVIILGSYECNIETGKGVIVFFKGENTYGDKFNGIKLIDFTTEIAYDIARGLWLNFDEVTYVDGVIDTDDGEDILYFVDNVNPPRHIKCLTDTLITNDKQICNLRYAPIDRIDLHNGTLEGGVLLSGSYQIAYKYVNTDTGLESTPSLFTNPIPVHPSQEKGYNATYGGVPNEQTSKKIRVRIIVDTSNTEINDTRDLYNAVSLLVIKITDGGKTHDGNVYITTPSKSFYDKTIQGEPVEYIGNEIELVTTIGQVSVDDALIETAKTITIKEGNLFLGNITYRDLSLKDSEGIVGNAYTYAKDLGLSSDILKPNNIREDPTEVGVSNRGGYLNDINASKYKSEMRGEVIRYGLAYMDEFGGWSEPRAIDFSGFSALERVSDTQYNITSVQEEKDRGVTLLVFDNTATNSIKVGDFIETNDGDYHLVMDSTSTDVRVDSFFTTNPTSLYELKGGEYNNSKGVDWKYPERKNGKFTLLNDTTQGGISSLGLYLDKISNHPSWAKALTVLRVSRNKNILTQAVALPCSAGNGSAELIGDDVQPAPYANIVGSFFAKPLSRGGNVNTTRWTPDNEGYAEPLRSDSNDEKTGTRHDVLPLVKLLSPDYMYSNVANTEIYDASWFGSGYTLDLVDAVSMFRTDSIEFNDQTDNGTDKGDEQAYAFRADSRENYYYQKGINNSDLANITDTGNNRRLYVSNNTIKGYYPAVNGIAPIALPVSLLPDNPTIRNIVVLGDLRGVSGYNTSEQYAIDNNIDPKEQKGVYVVLDKVFGDISYFSAQLGQSPSSGDYYKDFILFSRSGTINDFFNVDQDKLRYTGVDSNTEWNNFVNNEAKSSLGVLGITNVTRGLSDDRYGDLTKSHIFLPTGTYKPLYKGGSEEEVDALVFGGDTFISKPTFKVNESILGAFKIGEGDLHPNHRTAIRAYSNWIELVSCYIESDVNSQLQADPYSYPIEDKKTPTEFKKDYNYPYHFGYSAKNLSKVWINANILDSDNSTKFESRVVYSDKHIINSNDGNYGRFRTSSLFDLDGSYGAITKLLKAYDDNVYCIQTNGFSLIPIGKKTIEDGAGGEMVINTSDTITTPKYFLNNNGCQNIESVKQSKDSFFWVDKDRREVFVYKGSPKRVSDMGMYSFFNQKLDRYDDRIDGVFDFDKEEYIISIEGESIVFSSKVGVWSSRLELQGFNSFISGEDRLFVIGRNGVETSIEEMYVTEEFGNVLGVYNDSSVNLTFNDGGTIPKTFDAVRVDSTAHIDECRMVVRGLNDEVLDTGLFSINEKGRQGGYEYPSLRDETTRQRLRGKACEMMLIIKNDSDTKFVSINNVLLKYRESPNAFRKQYNLKSRNK